MSLDALAAAERDLAALGPKPFPLPLGPLAPVVAGAFTGASKADWVVCGPRERVGAVLRGCAVERLVDPAAGARPYKLAPSSGTPGARALHAVGLAAATNARVLCILGDASTAAGAFHEALNSACLLGARVTFLVVCQPLGEGAPVGTQLATTPWPQLRPRPRLRVSTGNFGNLVGGLQEGRSRSWSQLGKASVKVSILHPPRTSALSTVIMIGLIGIPIGYILQR